VDVDRILAIALAWLATFAVHGAVLCAAAAAIGIAIARVPLARMVGRARLAAARERLWKLAIFGGLATATLTTAGAGPWQLRIALERDRPAAGRATGKEVAAGSPVLPAPAPALPSSAPATESSTRVIDPAWLRFAAWIWLAGIASGAAAWTRDRRRIAGQLRGRVRATSGPAREILTELRRRSGARRDPDLYFAPGLASPISLAFGKKTSGPAR